MTSNNYREVPPPGEAYQSGLFKGLTEEEVHALRMEAQTPFLGAGITWLKFQGMVIRARMPRCSVADIEFVEYDSSVSFARVLALYESVSWTNYTKNPDQLGQGLLNSSYVVVALLENFVVGLVRCISDGHTICYIQDVLVRPEAQRRGIGRALVENVLEQYADVRQVVLMTDAQESQLAFYSSLGFRKIEDDLTGFVRFNNS
jgi:ribosomal protein S18 acetylase RimI-like enzyme